jgi:molybdenum cofactor cytidylyltransferase
MTGSKLTGHERGAKGVAKTEHQTVPNRSQGDRRLFAIVPAAGMSRRMGRAKLLLPYGGTTVIAALLDVLDCADIAARVVVVRDGDIPLKQAVAKANATVVSPETDPPDMRSSVAFAIEEIERLFSPDDDEGWLIVPADHPQLDADLFHQLLTTWKRGDDTILVPTHAGRRGHPTFFRWSLTREIPHIPPDAGLNWLLKTQADAVTECPVDDPAVVTDLDTPEDYEALRNRQPRR